MERLAVIDLVKLPHRPAPGITDPTRHRTDLALRQKLHAVTPAVAYSHLGLPVGRVTHIRSALFVFDQVQRPLVITFYAQLHLPEDVVTDPCRYLHRPHRRHIVRHRNPHIARQRQRTVAQQMHILAHVRITRFDSHVLMHQKTHTDPRFGGRIHFAADAVHTEPCAVVQPKPSDRTPCVLYISRNLVAVQGLVADRRVHIERPRSGIAR